MPCLQLKQAAQFVTEGRKATHSSTVQFETHQCELEMSTPTTAIAYMHNCYSSAQYEQSTHEGIVQEGMMWKSTVLTVLAKSRETLTVQDCQNDYIIFASVFHL